MILLAAVLIGLAVAQLATLATTLYLHRALSHRALTLSRPASTVARTVLWITTGLKPREWVAVHRRHHAASDTPSDPHSPVQLGFWRVQLTNAALYRRVARDGITVDRYAKDLPPDRLDRVLFDRAFVGLGLGIGVLVVVLGPVPGLIAAVVHTVAYLQLNSAVNAVGHTWGRRPYDNLATNNQWLAWLTAGEGLHNNHHAAPTSARFAHRRGEFDPAWLIVRALVRTGSAELRHADGRIPLETAA